MSLISLRNTSFRLVGVFKLNSHNRFASTSSTKPESGSEDNASREKTDNVAKKLRAKTPIGNLVSVTNIIDQQE
jgi:hypothetical protein